MLTPEVADRFRKIEDTLAVIAELQRRAESRTQEDLDRLRAIQNAMAQWQDKMADRQDDFDVKLTALTDAQLRLEATVERLSETLDRFLKSRSNGGVN